ncbi:hypothetical protein A6U97_26495 [Agrobacterium tumefaciens]|uniref:hypothetical protein n=1 Tax=Agrobacterium tumefaciens TaxID=358 RepID=UPI00080F7699|nr:hypothetical protein A6U97_26495 [Agrobacterium tumefaciens]
MTNWTDKANDFGSRFPGTELGSYVTANINIIRQTVSGIGIDSGRRDPGSGIRVVFNLSSAHVQAFLGAGYKNCYDLIGASARLGGAPPKAVSARRRRIDDAIAHVAGGGVKAETLYYGAIELNGAGMRYYGDMCLVLKADPTQTTGLILYRNSYDLDRDPLRSRIAGDAQKLQTEARQLAGEWCDAPDMVVCKIMDGAALMPRLMTSGHVSTGILSDEDYIEMPRSRSFTAGDLQEVRTASADVAAEARIADRQNHGPAPSLAQILWRRRRRDAERAFGATAIPVRVITSLGRVRA